MKDRNVEFPRRFHLTKVEGTDDIYDLEPAPGEITEEGTLLNKANLLTDETAKMIGLTTEDPTVNEALLYLAQPVSNTGNLFLHCVNEDGAPVSGCVATIGGETFVTAERGIVKFALTPDTYSVTIRSPIDYGAETQILSFTIAIGEVIVQEVTIEDKMGGATELRITNSIPLAAFSDRVLSADVFGVGGGGSGAVFTKHGSTGNSFGVTGGAGGYTKTATVVDVITPLVLTIGSGGAAKTVIATSDGTYANGAAGGKTSVVTMSGTTVLSAAGGAGGTYNASGGYNYGANGGSGSGACYVLNGKSYAGDSGEDGADGSYAFASGCYGGSGQGTTTRLWGETNGELFASAGGSAARTDFLYTDGAYAVGKAGTGAGAAYTNSTTTVSVDVSAGSGTTYGSGGGAAALFTMNAQNKNVSSGAGKQGLIVFRWEVSA